MSHPSHSIPITSSHQFIKGTVLLTLRNVGWFFGGVGEEYRLKCCGELNFITIFVRREEAAVKQYIVLFPEAEGEPQVSWVFKAWKYIHCL